MLLRAHSLSWAPNVLVGCMHDCALQRQRSGSAAHLMHGHPSGCVSISREQPQATCKHDNYFLCACA